MHRITRDLLLFALGFGVPIVLTLAVLPRTMPGDAELFAEAQRISGRKCVSNDAQAEEDGEAGGLCAPPRVINQDLAKIEAYGLYDHTTNPRVVYVDFNTAPPGSQQFKEVVIHEYTHYLQWVNGDLKPKGDPCERSKLEIEAHKVDQEYTTPGEISENANGIIFGYMMMCMMWRAENGL